MARRTAKVTWKNADKERIPESIGEGAVLTLDLANRGMLEQIGERFRIRREGGYCGFDVVLFLLLYFSCGVEIGLRKFWETVRPCNRKVAAIAGRKQLASPASMSRALSAVETALLRPAAEWLLSEGAGIDELLRHPSVQTYDACGEGWHVFDFDPTVTTLRHRALPEGEDLPAARRRSEHTAAPGYSGRKRGDVQFSRGTLQHAGSAAWLQAMLGPGSGDGRAQLQAALGVVVRTCNRLRHPLARTMLRMDGGFGWVPYLAACRSHGVGCLTRLTRRDLYEQPDVLRQFREGPWYSVPDSLSGPRRSALDLGVVTLPPGHGSHQEDGTPYPPVAVRVVVSRFPQTGKATHGRVIDGWQYEMFVADVPAEAFPAPEVVAQYFGRAGQENRFAQEDREAGLDRIFSYHLPGQEFATVIGLWTWNLRLARGFELAPPPPLRPAQQPYVAEVDTRAILPASAPVADDLQQLAVQSDAPQLPAPAPVADDVQQTAVQAEERLQDASTPVPVSAVSTDAKPGIAEVTEDPPETEIQKLLRSIDWEDALRRNRGWSFDPTDGRLKCRDGRDLVLFAVRRGVEVRGRMRLMFRRPSKGCLACELPARCLDSDNPRRAKRIEIPVPSGIAIRLRELLAGRHNRAAESKAARAAATPPRPRSAFVIAPLPPTAVFLAVLPALFLPAVARQLLRSAAAGLSIAVKTLAPPAHPPWPILMAPSIAHKQHRRKTWQQNLERHALDPRTTVSVELAGSELLRHLLSTPAREAPL